MIHAYSVEYTRDAVKALKGMPASLHSHVQAKITSLAADPFNAPNVRKLVGREGYRLRVGDWRVIYEIDGAQLVVLVLAIAPRGGIYK